MTVTNTVPPAISGTAQQGHALTTTDGTWTFSLDYLTYAYEWERCDAAGANCVAIPSAATNVYYLQAADVGHTIRSQVTATEHSGTPPAPPAGYPASYFTGPLGMNNPVPADTGGALLIMWTGVVGFSSQQQRDLNVQRMNDCGRTFDGIQFQGTGLDVSGSLGEDWVHSYGMLPIHVWNPGTSTATILSGGANAAIDAEINRMKVHGYRVMIRLMHEFNLPNTPYYGLANPSQFVNAWRYIVNRFQAQGATNCGFWWCPTEQAGNPERSSINACYPGDTYVDWVGADSYNNDSGYSAPPPITPGWTEFDQLTRYEAYGWTGTPGMCTQWGPIKPYVQGETGSRYSTTPTTRKASWFTNIDSVAKQNNPYLRGIAFFDFNTGSIEYQNWRVDANQTTAMYNAHNLGSTDATTYQGFKDLAAIARWNVGRTGG